MTMLQNTAMKCFTTALVCTILIEATVAVVTSILKIMKVSYCIIVIYQGILFSKENGILMA